MADADVLDLLGLEIDLRQLVDQAHLGRDVGRGHGIAGIPQQVVVAVLDEIAAVDELKLQVAIGIGVRHALVDGGRRIGRAAIQPRQRDLRRLCQRRLGDERGGAKAGQEQCPLHVSSPSFFNAAPSHITNSVVSTGAPPRRPLGGNSAEWRDLLSTIGRLSLREGLSARPCGPRSRRRRTSYAMTRSPTATTPPPPPANVAERAGPGQRDLRNREPDVRDLWQFPSPGCRLAARVSADRRGDGGHSGGHAETPRVFPDHGHARRPRCRLRRHRHQPALCASRRRPGRRPTAAR